MSLTDHMKETADIIGGYITGTLIIEDSCVSLQNAHGEILELTDEYCIEVRNDGLYEAVRMEQILTLRTDEGWPLLAGMYVRVKKN